MTQLLEHAIAELHKLPASDQDAIAALILDEINDERRWETSFNNSQDELAKMAEKVRNDIRTGQVRDVGFDQL